MFSHFLVFLIKFMTLISFKKKPLTLHKNPSSWRKLTTCFDNIIRSKQVFTGRRRKTISPPLTQKGVEGITDHRWKNSSFWLFWMFYYVIKLSAISGSCHLKRCTEEYPVRRLSHFLVHDCCLVKIVFHNDSKWRSRVAGICMASNAIFTIYLCYTRELPGVALVNISNR